MFTTCKKKLKCNYKENDKNLEIFVARTLKLFDNYNATKIFRKSGYTDNNKFDPTVSIK